MQNPSSSRRIRKHYVALALVLLAIASWMLRASYEQGAIRAALNVSDIPMAMAKDDRVSGDLQMFLKLDDIAGNAGSVKHKGEIDIDSYAWGVDRPLGSTKPALQTFTLTLPAGRASPKLFLMSTGGVRLQRAVLAVQKTGTEQDFLRWILTDITIVSFKTVGNVHGDGMSDQIVLSFGKIEVEYTPPEGGSTVKAGWDQRTGKSVGY